MDSILQKALERRADIQRESEALRREDEELAIFIKMHQRLSGAPEPVQPSQPGAAHALIARLYATKDSPLRAPSKRALIEAAAEQVLLSEQPLMTPEIVKRLAQRNVEVGGADPAINLASYLSKSEKFRYRKKHGGWFLAENAPEAETESPPAMAGTEGS